LNKNLSSEKRTPNDLNLPFKEKLKERAKGRSQLGAQWKVLMFGGQWNVPMFDGPLKVLIFGGIWKENEKHFFTSSHFPLTNFI
jgi:hypothetical protein